MSFQIICQLKVYETEVTQEDGSDKLETVDEAKNMLTVLFGFEFDIV
jgi:hypothetical protein